MPKGFAMTRMTREFTLVLLGTGLLTTGYFAWPEQDFEKRAEEQAQKRVGGGNGNGTTRTHATFVYIGYHGTGTSTMGRSPAMASVSRGGFGSIGGRVGGGVS
jgi:hypothetical protein